MAQKKEESLPKYASRASSIAPAPDDYASVHLRKTLSDNRTVLSIDFNVKIENLKEKLEEVSDLIKKTF